MQGKISLRQAGYRERAFTKARMAELGIVDQFAWALDHYRYDPHHDKVYPTHGAPWEVRWEGSQSREILARHGADDSGCDPIQDSKA